MSSPSPDPSKNRDLIAHQAKKNQATSPASKKEGKLVAQPPPRPIRILLFTQRHVSELILEVAHNILQSEIPFPHEVERMATVLDTGGIIEERPLMPPRTVEEIQDNQGSYDFHVISLILSNHFGIPFAPWNMSTLLEERPPPDVEYPLYVVNITCSHKKKPKKFEDFIDHCFCVRSFLTNGGERQWVVLDSVFVALDNPFLPISLSNLQNYLFGNIGETQTWQVGHHLRSHFSYVTADNDKIKVYGFFAGKLDKLDGPTNLSLEDQNILAQHFDSKVLLTHRPRRQQHNAQTGSFSVHLLNELSYFPNNQNL